MSARVRTLALAVGIAFLVVALSLPAAAAGPKRIFITKYDENFVGQAGVTFELYQDTDGDGVRDAGEPLLQTKVTDAAGRATFDPVNPGKYVVHEVTPAGYADNPDKEVEIPNAKGPGPQIVFSNTPTPSNNRVNDPAGDTGLGDGTHVFDFGPSIAATPDGTEVLVAYNHSAGFLTPGGVSGIETAFSTDGGATFGPGVKVASGSGSAFLLGDPTVLYDPLTDRWIVAMDAITNFGTLQQPIMVATASNPNHGWGTPVAIPGIPASLAVAHGADLIDIEDLSPGGFALVFTLSNADGTSQPMVSRSTNGGTTWSSPNPIAGPGSHFDFVDGAMSPDGRLHATWGDYGAVGTYDVFHSSTSDPHVTTWDDLAVVAEGIPRSGTSGGCTDSPDRRTLFGSLVPFDAPEIAVSPLNANRIFTTFPRQGPPGDESDVMLSTSNDGGITWSQPTRVGPADGRVQFAPSVSVTPDGRLGTSYFDADAAGTEYGVELVFYDVLTGAVEFGPAIPITQTNSSFWETDPSFDTHYSNCFGLPPLGMTAPGSGFFVAWADGRDPGPAGNDGIDPNIYFARTEGPPIATTLTASVTKTGSKIKPSGTLTPRPVPGAKVTVTLFRNTGDGFEQIGRKRPTTSDKGGAWATSFARPDDGKCQILVEFGGAEGRAPSSPVTKTFAC